MRWLLLVALTSCKLTDECADVACTDEVEAVTVHVVDAAGAPVTGLHPITRVNSAGQTLTVDQSFSFQSGDYVVVSDSELAAIDTGGTELTFEVSSSQGSAVGHFQIATTSCRCHIMKVDGPVTLVLQ